MEVKRSGRRGRPPQTAEDVERIREGIVAATAAVFAVHGSHNLSVALVIEQAGIARPTFYRYFANVEEPLAVLLHRSDTALVDGIRVAAESAEDAVALAISVIGAYLQWAADRGPTLRPLFRECYDPSSPVSTHREIALAGIRTLLNAKMIEFGRSAPEPLELDTLLSGCEFLGYRVSLADGNRAEITERAQAVMVRMAIATLGRPEDLMRALSIPGAFG